MRIGIFTDTYPPFINGVSTSIAMLEKGLREKGHDVFIVTVNPENFSYKYENEDRIIRIPGVPTGIYDYRLTGIYSIKALNKIKDWKLDIIHSHTEFGIGTFARIVAKQYNIPLVHTYHTMYEEYIYYITKGYFSKASKKLVEYLTLFLCDKLVEELIVPTKKTYDLFKEKYKVKRDVNIIPTGIDVSRFYKENIDKEKVNELRHDLKLSRFNFNILYVGRIAKEKSIDFLINNFKDIVKKIPRAKLIIVGDGPDMKELIDLVVKNKLNRNCLFTGKVPWNEVPLYYMLSSVFVTASKSETQGLTVIEAMAASKPVVAINDESFSLVIESYKDGILFNDDKEYKDAIYMLYKDRKLRDKISLEARKTANNYSDLSYAKNVLEVYKKVINKDSNFIHKIINNIKCKFNR